MNYAFRLKKYDAEANEITLSLFETLNTEHIKTLYSGDISNVRGELSISDPRELRPEQRGLYFALLNDIYSHLGPPQDFLHEYFKGKYQALTYGEKITLKQGSGTTVSQANQLINIVIDFVFEWNVPIKDGYELLPKDNSYYLYKCCKHRKCAVCGKHADIHHHEGLVGKGGNRNEFDHRDSKFIALCRTHHNEAHNIGLETFEKQYHLKAIKLNEETLKLLGLMTAKTIRKLDER